LLSSSAPLVLTLGMWAVLRREDLGSISLAGRSGTERALKSHR
jgi:hypothetical protein